MLPVLGVCIPVHEDPEGVAIVLDRLEAADYPRELLQIVVAVDGADPMTVAAATRPGVEVLPLALNRGSYAARNAAIDALRPETEVVVFTDGDCQPVPGFLKAHVETLKHAELSGGAIEVTLREHPSPAEWTDKRRHLRQQHYVTVDHYAATANLAVRRSVLDTMRFSETLQTGGDADFGRRATAAGLSLVYSPDALVLHPARQTTAELMRKIRRICGGMATRPEYWKGRGVPYPIVGRSLVREARAAIGKQGTWWEARMLGLELRCQWMVWRSALKQGAVTQRPGRPGQASGE